MHGETSSLRLYKGEDHIVSARSRPSRPFMGQLHSLTLYILFQRPGYEETFVKKLTSMGQLVSNARAPIFNSRRQQQPPNAAVALDSVFSDRPISVAYVRSGTTSRSHSHSRRRSVLRRPARSEPPSRRTSTSHRSRRFSIFLARPVYPTLRRVGPSIVNSSFATPLSEDANFGNDNVTRYCDVCSDHINIDLHIHNQYAENHRQDDDYWSIENARIPWCNFCRIYFSSQSLYRKHIMSVMRHNRRLLESARNGASEVASGSNAALPTLTNYSQSDDHHNRTGVVDRLHCTPCDRFFSTDAELREHQLTARCTYTDMERYFSLESRRESEIPPLPPTRSNSTFSRISRMSRSSNAMNARRRTRPQPLYSRSGSVSRTRSRSYSRFNPPIPFRSVSTGLAESAASDRPTAESRQPSFEEWVASTFQGSPPTSLRTDVESTAASTSSRPSSFLVAAVRRARHAIVVYRRNSVANQTSSSNECEMNATTTKTFSYPCSICMGEEEELSSLACGHVFGTECLRAALRRKNGCPLCRKYAEPSDMRRIYLT